MIKKKDICESCRFYSMIDSGYGNCTRFPPFNQWKRKRFWHKELKLKKIEYLLVEWCRRKCGEYQKRQW